MTVVHLRHRQLRLLRPQRLANRLQGDNIAVYVGKHDDPGHRNTPSPGMMKLKVAWPWFTLIGTLVTLGVAWLASLVFPPRAAPIDSTGNKNSS